MVSSETPKRTRALEKAYFSCSEELKGKRIKSRMLFLSIFGRNGKLVKCENSALASFLAGDLQRKKCRSILDGTYLTSLIAADLSRLRSSWTRGRDSRIFLSHLCCKIPRLISQRGWAKQSDYPMSRLRTAWTSHFLPRLESTGKMDVCKDSSSWSTFHTLVQACLVQRLAVTKRCSGCC